MRVIAGELGGRRLFAPRGKDTRPTADRVREAIFSMIGAVDGLRALDLYAGSGALAIEALSRGAQSAVLVERSRPALAVVRRNLATLGLVERATVVGCAIERAKRTIAERGPYQLVFVDPPYADVATGAVSSLLDELCGAFDDEGLVVLEHASRDPSPAQKDAKLERTRRYGDTAVSLYRVTRASREAK